MVETTPLLLWERPNIIIDLSLSFPACFRFRALIIDHDAGAGTRFYSVHLYHGYGSVYRYRCRYAISMVLLVVLLDGFYKVDEAVMGLSVHTNGDGAGGRQPPTKRGTLVSSV